jgi:plastocyanin
VKTISAKLVLLAYLLVLVGATHAVAQEKNPAKPLSLVPIVALDECDPDSFNAVLGPDFCKNVALATFHFATSFSDFLNAAQNGTPDPGWDFEPDVLHVDEGTMLVVTNQGGEPHTFTEVKKFGGGSLEALNAGQEMVPECSGGFKNLGVAKTRIIQGSQMEVTGLSKGEHHFECCIHPWMRVTVQVK